MCVLNEKNDEEQADCDGVLSLRLTDACCVSAECYLRHSRLVIGDDIRHEPAVGTIPRSSGGREAASGVLVGTNSFF